MEVSQRVRRRVTAQTAMADVVILRHPNEDFTVRASVLRCHSSVFDGIVADGAPTEEGIVLTMDDVSEDEVLAFLALLNDLSHDALRSRLAGQL